MTREMLKVLLVVVAAPLLLSLLFVSQAFHIDDTYFILVARQILHDPLHPLSHEVNWNGVVMKAYDFSGSPPLFEYYLALIIRLFGESEVALHLSIIPISMLAVFCIYMLGRRFTSHPLSAALLAFSTPAFYVMSHTVMLDLPMATIFFLAVTCFIYGYDRGSPSLLVASGVFIAAAALIKYSGLMLIPLLFAYALLRKGRWSHKAFYLLIPVVLMGLYFRMNMLQYGELHLLKASQVVFRPGVFSPIRIALKGSAVLLYLGGAFIFPLSLSVLLKKAMGAWAFISITVIAAAAAACARMLMHYSLSSSFLIFILLGNGIGFLYLLFKEQAAGLMRDGLGSIVRLSDDLFLALWLIGVAVFNLFIVFTAVRYVLPLAAPLVLIFFRLCEKKKVFAKERARRTFYAATIAATFLLSFVVACADRDYAEVYRSFTVTHEKSLRVKGRTVWFGGHWGFQYYMERLGCVALGMTGRQPEAKDIVIKPVFPDVQPVTAEFIKRLRYRADYLYPSKIPVRTMYEGSGFYAHGYGLLPYSISGGPLERISIYEVE